MEYYSKILFLLTTIALGLLSTTNGQAPCSGVAATSTKAGKTNTRETVTKGHFYDTCNSTGTFKSNSICYDASVGGAPAHYVAPYQYFNCIPYGNSFILYPRKCTGPPVVLAKDDANLETKSVIFNAYNPSTGKCDLIPTGTPETPLATNATQVAVWPLA